jgi:hypothetical protein
MKLCFANKIPIFELFKGKLYTKQINNFKALNQSHPKVKGIKKQK